MGSSISNQLDNSRDTPQNRTPNAIPSTTTSPIHTLQGIQVYSTTIAVKGDETSGEAYNCINYAGRNLCKNKSEELVNTTIII